MEVMTQLMTTTMTAKELSVPRTAYATEMTKSTEEISAPESLRAAETVALVEAPTQVVDLGTTTTTSVAVYADLLGGIADDGFRDKDRIMPERNPGTLPSVERTEVPTPAASVVCSATTAESGASELGVERCATANVRPPLLAAEGWARDAQMVEGIFRIMEGMEPPWITLDVLESATMRFPTIDREVLRRTIMTVMMTQRRCVVRLTRAGLRRGARTDRDGNSFVELDLDFADRYSMSH